MSSPNIPPADTMNVGPARGNSGIEGLGPLRGWCGCGLEIGQHMVLTTAEKNGEDEGDDEDDDARRESQRRPNGGACKLFHAWHLCMVFPPWP